MYILPHISYASNLKENTRRAKDQRFRSFRKRVAFELNFSCEADMVKLSFLGTQGG